MQEEKRTHPLNLTGLHSFLVLLLSCAQACYEWGIRALLVPAAVWESFNLDAELPGQDKKRIRAWARKVVKPYTTMLEAIHAAVDPGASLWEW